MELDELLSGLDSLSEIIKSIENKINNYAPLKCGRATDAVSAESQYKMLKESRTLYILNDIQDDELLKWSKKCPKGIYQFYKCSGKSFFIIRNICKTFDKKVVSAVKKKKLIYLEPNNREEFLTSITGLDENYFALKTELMKYQILFNYVKSLFVKVLEKEEGVKLVGDSYKQFTFVGLLEKDQPNGFGYLLTKDNQLVLSGFWQNGFPILIYEVNNYHSSKGASFLYRYRPTGTQSGANKLCINSQTLQYSDSGISSFSLYVGEYEWNSTMTMSGHGTYFHEKFEETDLLYYQGYWKENKKNGNGVFQGKSNYNGVFENDEFKSGICTLSNGEKRQGDFKNWQLNGVGEVTSANGNKTKGYYENGLFIKSIEQYQQDLEAERKRQEELLALQNSKSLKSQHGEEIKEKFRKLLWQIALSGGMSDSETDAATDAIMADIETNIARRKLTELDEMAILELSKDAAAEVKLSLMLLNAGGALTDGMNQSSNNGNSKINKSSSSATPSNQKSRTCYTCEGSGECSECTKTFSFRIWKKYGGWDDVKETKPGWVKCGGCSGYGETLRGSDVHTLRSEPCHVSGCNRGWQQCPKCYGYGELGKCHRCNGTGIDD